MKTPRLPPMHAAQSLLGGSGVTAGVRAPLGETCTVTYRQGASGEVGRVRVRPSGDDAVHVFDLQVDPSHRGAGLGAQLLAAALRVGSRWGRTTAWLEADDDGSGRLIRWYERQGFVRAGIGRRGRPAMTARLGGAARSR